MAINNIEGDPKVKVSQAPQGAYLREASGLSGDIALRGQIIHGLGLHLAALDTIRLQDTDQGAAEQARIIAEDNMARMVNTLARGLASNPSETMQALTSVMMPVAPKR